MIMFAIDAGKIAQTLGACVVAYAAIVLLLRISGKRTLSKWNAFDFVVTVALGSSLATTVLSGTTSIGQGIAGFAGLVGLQYAVTWLTVRTGFLDTVVKARPVVLVWRGEYREAAMRRERVTRSEVLAALRAHGLARSTDAAAVVLETDGGFSVLTQIDASPDSTLRNLPDFEAQ